jgi:hypothetical protein
MLGFLKYALIFILTLAVTPSFGQTHRAKSKTIILNQLLLTHRNPIFDIPESIAVPCLADGR